MGKRHVDERIQRDLTGSALKRRGILRAAGIAVGGMLAGMAAKQAAAPVAANADVTFRADGPALQGFFTNGSFTTGVDVTGSTYGVKGSSTGTGVFGTSSTAGEKGVWGSHPGNGYGVYGDASDGGVGTTGVGTTGYGVIGVASTGTGVYGHTTASGGTGAIGVLGQSDSATSIGVRGLSKLGTGVSGSSNGNTGVFGTTTATGFSALGGIVSTPGTAAFAGTATVPTAFAGFFTGDVFVNGNFTVNDPTKKHGAIAHPDGSHRILYSMESPESWIEDFGTGHLVTGTATVTLDPDFAAVVYAEDYLVFLTPKGDSRGLTVAVQDATGFVVQEIGGGTGAGAFSWRVVAKPKTTNKAARMAKFVIPDIKVPGAGDAPLPPAPPAAPMTPEPPPPAAPPSRPTLPVATPSQGSGTVQGGTTNPVQPAPPPRP